MRNLDLSTSERGAGKQAIDDHERARSQRPDGLEGRLTSSLIYNRNNKSLRKERRQRECTRELL